MNVELTWWEKKGKIERMKIRRFWKLAYLAEAQTLYKHTTQCKILPHEPHNPQSFMLPRKCSFATLCCVFSMQILFLTTAAAMASSPYSLELEKCRRSTRHESLPRSIAIYTIYYYMSPSGLKRLFSLSAKQPTTECLHVTSIIASQAELKTRECKSTTLIFYVGFSSTGSLLQSFVKDAFPD